MYEPVHGSAPDIVGRSIANPLATIWAGALVLDQLREAKATKAVISSMGPINDGPVGQSGSRCAGGKLIPAPNQGPHESCKLSGN